MPILNAHQPMKIVGLAGSHSKPSKTLALVDYICTRAETQFRLEKTTFDMMGVGPSLGTSMSFGDLDAQAQFAVDLMLAADVLVVGAPTYKGSYPGLFKHLFDLLDPASLRGKVIVIAGTGGGDRHALMVEHQLRPLFGFFMAHTVATSIYASDKDFEAYTVRSEALASRVDEAMSDIAAFVRPGTPRRLLDLGPLA
ncbi:FMN reductase [Rhizobium jaguaris]|nr:FMN reductase [Rhizobium jaguaris]